MDENARVIQEFRTHGGNVGGAYAGYPLLLLHHAGGRSGIERVTPLAFWTVGSGQVAVLASNFGADRHPAWYFNLLAHPVTTVEIGREVWRVRATVASGPERNELLDRMTRLAGARAALARTSREIPLIRLERLAGTDIPPARGAWPAQEPA